MSTSNSCGAVAADRVNASAIARQDDAPAVHTGPLYSLALGAFAVGTEGFMIAAILPRIADDLSVSLQMAGQLVTAFTLVYALSSPILTTITSRLDRRKLLLMSIGVFVVGNVVAASAAGYGSLLLARVIMALASGLYGPNANALAGALVPKERRGRALAIVNGGTSVAVALGVPLGAFVGSHLGWRMTFAGVAVLAVVAFAGLFAGIPKGVAQGQSPATLEQRLAVVRQPASLAALFVTTLWAVGGYTVYTYIAAFLSAVVGVEGAQTGYFLFCWGAGAFVGLLIGGTVNDKIGSHRAIIVALPLMAVTLASLSVTAAYATPAVAALPVLLAIAVWGLTAWGFFPPQQARLIGIAGLQNAPIILSLNGSFMYLGFSLGAALGSATLTFGGVADLGWVGGLCVVASFLLFLVTDRHARASALPET
ncbi:MFS transporter [Aliidongia dinghuensis]|uniref:MFS transporter n=1 Tax=Aliidongia dinghuensis TaxID=1867774 RepID=A0A8J3E1B9_9PROT|nr:MFS transporter [Aliidongia dinghuensis]GGE98619.1 MFS transporter [Aliidongia dinghuensis]